MKNRLLLMVLLMVVTVAGRAQHFAFEAGALDPVWQHIGECNAQKYALKDGRLRIYGDVFQLHEEGHPFSCVCQPVPDSLFTFETKMTLMDSDSGDEAGLLLYRSPQVYVQCLLNNNRSELRLRLRLQLYSQHLVLENVPIGASHRQIWLRVAPKKGSSDYEFSYSSDGEAYHRLGTVERHLLSASVAGCSEALRAGVYCLAGSGKFNAGYPYADFDYIDINNVNE